MLTVARDCKNPFKTHLSLISENIISFLTEKKREVARVFFLNMDFHVVLGVFNDKGLNYTI